MPSSSEMPTAYTPERITSKILAMDSMNLPKQSSRHRGGPLRSPDFIIPAKSSKAVAINKPPSIAVNNDSNSKQGIAEQAHQTSDLEANNTAHDIWPALGTSTLNNNSNSLTNKPSAISSSVSSKEKPAIPKPEHNPASHVVDSSLDIYANKYIPFWLQAVNESFAVAKPSVSPKHINHEEYIRRFAGASFARALSAEQLPSLTTPTLRCADLDPSCYELYWKERLHLEFCAQNEQYSSYSLYAVSLETQNVAQHLYRLKLPGVRENAPRIDLGDVINVRPLVPILNANIGEAARQWNKTREGIAPGFLGFEYQAVVWSVYRRKEEITLRIDGEFDTRNKCNVLIPVQKHKCTPLWRAVAQTGYRLSTSRLERNWRRSILFPEISDGVLQKTLSKGTFNLDWYDQDLNYEQKKAIHAAVCGSYGSVPYLISGPPGTGKTKTLVETALQLLHLDSRPKHHLLVCAPSDAAADTLLERLSLNGHLSPAELFRLNGWTRSLNEVPGTVRPFCELDENNLFTLPDFKRMMNFRIVVTTCRDADMLIRARLTNDVLTLMTFQLLEMVSPGYAIEAHNLLHWTGLLLDEAAQATEPEAMIPLNVVAPVSAHDNCNLALPIVVMAGDEYQLGPQLSTKQKNGYEMSLFQRLFNRSLYADHPLSRQNGLRPLKQSMLPIIQPTFTNLIRNYRSHPAILSTPSALFYHNTLIPERLNSSSNIMSWRHWSSSTLWPVLFWQNDTTDDVESVLEGDGTGVGSLLNRGEAEIALNLTEDLLMHSNSLRDNKLSPEDICVMSPFRAQVNYLRALYRDRGLSDVNIGPVEAFQGLEKRVVILCTTRTRLGQPKDKLKQKVDKYVRDDQARRLGIIDEPKRFNVAITRAMEGLIVIGNAKCLTCTQDVCWTSFISFCLRNKLVSPTKEASQILLDPAQQPIVGTLEKALRYADFIKQRNSIRSEQPSLKSSSSRAGSKATAAVPGFSQQSVIPSQRKIKLKGTMTDLDEQMWQMCELKMQEDSEEIDSAWSNEPTEKSALNVVDPDSHNIDSEKTNSDPLKIKSRMRANGQNRDQSSNPIKSITSKVKAQTHESDVEWLFDRDLADEIERAGCETQ